MDPGPLAPPTRDVAEREREDTNLDFLRAAAVLFVLLFHLLLWFQATKHGLRNLGHWGVLIFFIHTSLVLMSSLARQGEGPFGRGYVVFMVRRCARILPLSTIVVLAVFLLRLPVGHLRDHEFVSVEIDLKTLVSNLLLIQNLTGSESVMATLWSLPYEMEMYLVLPLLFVLATRSRSVGPLLAVWIAAVVLGALTRHGSLEMPAYVPCFVAGVIAYKQRASAGARRLPAHAWPPFVLAVTAAFLARPTRPMSWLCCLAIGLGIPLFAHLPRGRFHRACQLVARYSYGVYLTHFILIWLAFARLAALPVWARAAVFVLTTVSLPVALYHLVEAPMIAVGRSATERWWPRAAARGAAPR